jgi:hypothetical protein
MPDTLTDEAPFRSGFEPRLRGVRAECDGGAPIAGSHLAGRQDFAGRLTGNYRDFGPYPWRWYLMTELTKKPHGYFLEAVWCDSGNLTILDQDKLSIPLVP